MTSQTISANPVAPSQVSPQQQIQKNNLGNRVETAVSNTIFSHRIKLIVVFASLTLWFFYHALQIRPDASFEKMIPTYHPYIANFLDNRDDLKGLGNAVRISIENTGGDIFNAEFQQQLKEIHDEVFFIPGVDRGALKSLWASSVRWTSVTEEGFAGGPVIPDSYNGSPASLQILRQNIMRSGQVGSLVANDFKSAVIYAPLLEKNPDTGEALDYQVFSQRLEALIRDKYQSDKIKIHITGFAKIVGDLIDGAMYVALFFALTVLFSWLMLIMYTRCLRSASIALICSIIAVIWQLGILHLLGYGLDPYSMLVPFLVFAIGVSHGVQIFNSIVHNVMRGSSKVDGAKQAFRTIYVPGLTALVSDGIGFATLMVIEIAVIQDLAIAASIGVAVIILTNLVLLPVLISFSGVSKRSVEKLIREEEGESHPLWHGIAAITRPKVAGFTLLIGAGLFVVGLNQSQDLKIGDFNAGAPELRPDSRYNQDVKFITDNYSTSTDVFVVMVKSTPDRCVDHAVLKKVEQLQWQLGALPAVQSSLSLTDIIKRNLVGANEGNIKWLALSPNQRLLDAASITAPPGIINTDCSMTPLIVYLNDHKADTLISVVKMVEQFAAENNTKDLQFLLAAGSAGIEAATNNVIKDAQYEMLIWVYGVVFLLCLISFRSLRTVLCIILPLTLTSVLCQALMAHLNIGVKVATLPVIALGVGIGVDYGIYIYSKMKQFLDAGKPLTVAYFDTLKTTGKAVCFTGITLAVGVGSWAFSPIKFQADMGILLTFMFLWNMVGALTLLPALTCFLHKRDSNMVE